MPLHELCNLIYITYASYHYLKDDYDVMCESFIRKVSLIQLYCLNKCTSRISIQQIRLYNNLSYRIILSHEINLV